MSRLATVVLHQNRAQQNNCFAVRIITSQRQLYIATLARVVIRSFIHVLLVHCASYGWVLVQVRVMKEEFFGKHFTAAANRWALLFTW